MSKELVKIEKEEWYQAMVEDCRAIIVERTFNSKFEEVLGKWELGDRILEEEDKGITNSLGQIQKEKFQVGFLNPIQIILFMPLCRLKNVIYCPRFF